MNKRFFIPAIAFLFIAALVVIIAISTGGETEPAVVEELTITGAWGYAYTIEGGNETPFVAGEFQLQPPTLEIGTGGSVLARFYETSIEGRLIKTGELTYMIIHQRATSEGETWELEDAFLSYDPASGVLRYTYFNEDAGVDVHHHFVRGASPLLEE